MHVQASTLDAAYRQVVKSLVLWPEFRPAPRDQRVAELLVPRIDVHDPRSRLITSPARAVDYGFAVGEFLWYWSGHDDLETMAYYNRRMPQFSDDGRTLNSAYGALFRGFKGPVGVDQWSIAIRTLQSDPDSRRAILQAHQPWHQLEADANGSKDVPCTLSLQFFVREKQLWLHTHMRSNDAWWGLPYDAFSFTLLQECMLLELRARGMDLDLGGYMHTAGSMHLYERHLEPARFLSKEEAPSPDAVWMLPVPDLEELDRLVAAERSLRTREIGSIDRATFSGGCRWMADRLNDHRSKRDREAER